MKSLTKYFIWFIFAILLTGNVFIFLNSIKLSDEINHFEKETKNLHQENLNIENKIYEVDSLQYAASMASELDFTQKAEPIYLENLKYAKNQ